MSNNTQYLQHNNPMYINISNKSPTKNITFADYKTNTGNKEYIKKINITFAGYKISTGNKRYEKKIKKILDKISKNNLDIIHDIYLKLKNSQYENEDVKIKKLIEEIKKNIFTDVQYFILALLIYRLINIDKFNLDKYPSENRINTNDIEKYKKVVFSKLTNNNFSNNKIKSIIQASYNSLNHINLKKQCIILRFIDEFIEVSIKGSELEININYFLDNFVKKNI
jgi:hypothetical protein